jgi:rubrerythrin
MKKIKLSKSQWELIGKRAGWAKKAQNLEVVKTPEKLTDRELTRAIRDAIIAEEGAIKQYETVADAADNAKVKEVLQDISNEEKVHVGELQTLLSMLLKDEQGFLDDGAKEVE